MGKQTAIKWMMAVVGMAGLAGMSAAGAAPFYDDFNRANSTTVGNGWGQATSDSVGMQPQIYSNQVAFLDGYPNGSPIDGYFYASITHTFDALPQVAVSLSWDRNRVQNGEFMTLSLTGATGTLDIWEKQYVNAGTYIPIQITYLGTTYWASISGVTTPNYTYYNYEIISTALNTSLYVDGELKWTTPDTGIGMMTSASVGAVNNYWKWHDFYADNFAATPEPASLALLALGGLGLLRRRRS